MKSLFSVFLSFFTLISEISFRGKRNIHLAEDEKFIDFAVREFNEAGRQSHLFIILGAEQKLKFIKSPEVLIIHPRLFWQLIPFAKGHINSFFFHSLPNKFYKNLILRIPKGIPIFWMSWGFDLINVFDDVNNYLKSKTKNISPIKAQHPKIKTSGISYYKAFKNLPETSSMLERIDFISTVIEEENKIIDLSFYQKVPQWVPWNYFTMEQDVIKGYEDKVISGNDILLGNSGNFWNNHLDAFDDLLQFQIDFDKVICPLSYGDQNYRNQISQEGDLIFGKKFVALNEFMAYPDYVKQLLSCKYVFMNSLRQLGLGNILLMLFLGSKVILDKSNPVFHFFNKNDIRVFSIEEAKSGRTENIDLENTRSNLIRIWGKNAIRMKTINLLNLFS